ncbi:hypothetical protein ABPG72_012560 [Tetrahymena utriculariae]
MELFVARAMIRDFRNETSFSIRNLPLINLQNFAVNSIYIITSLSQYEQDQLGFGILHKFCLIIQEDITREEQLNQNIKQPQAQNEFNAPRSNKFIEYIQRTRDRDVIKMKLKHQLDMGSSNLLSALCQLKYNLSGVDLSFCSFSCAYLFDYKGKSLNLTGSNLSCANISNSSINTTLSRTENCIQWKEQVIFDSYNQFSFSKINYFPDDCNILLCGSNTGYINIYCFDKNKRILQMNSNIRSRDNSLDAKYVSQQSLQNSQKQLRAQTDMSRQKSKSPKQRIFDNQKNLTCQNIRPGTSQSVRSNVEQLQNQLKISQVQMNNSLYNSTSNLSQISQNDEYQSVLANFQDSQLLKFKNYFKGAINDIEDYFNTVIVSQNSNVLCLHRDTLDLLSMLQAHDIGEIRISLCKSRHILATISSLESTCKIWQINKQKGFLLIQKIDDQLESFKHLMSAVKFSSDGKFLALGSTDTYVRIYRQSPSNVFALLQTVKSCCSSPIVHLTFSNNSQFVAVGGQNEEKYLTVLELTNQNSFYPIKISLEKENRCLSIVQFTPNCRYMVTSFRKNGKLQLWLLGKGKVSCVDCIQAFQDGSSVSSICFFYQQALTIDSVLEDAGNILMCVGSNDGQMLKTYCIRDNKFVLKEQKLIGHENNIEQIALSKSFVLSISKDQACILWNFSQLNQQLEQTQVQPYKVLDEFSKLQIQYASFSPDNKFFAVATKKKGKDDSFCLVYSFEDDKNILDIDKECLSLKIQSKNITCFCFSLDTQFLALADCECNSISIFRLETKEKIFEIPFDKKEQYDCINSNISFMQYSKSNKYLYAVLSDDSKACYLWDVQQQYHEIASIKLGKSNNRIIGTKITPDNNILRIITSKGELRSFNIQNNIEIMQKQYFQLDNRSLLHDGSNFQYVFSSFSQDCNYVAIGTKKQVEVWNLEQTQLQLIHLINENIFQLLHIQIIQSPHHQICVVDQEKRIRIFDLSQAIKKQKFNPQYAGHTTSIIQVEYSLGTSQYLLTTSKDNVSKLWNAHKGYQLIQTFQNTKQIHINQSEDILVIVPSDPMKSEVLFLDIFQNFEIIHTQKNIKKINKVCFSPNLQVIATCQQDSVKLWNYSRNEVNCIQELNCIDFAEIIKFSTDSVFIAASFSNGQLQLWKKERNQYLPLTNLTCNQEEKKFINVNSFAFSNNKKFLAVAFSNRTIIVWSIDKQNFQIKFEEKLVYGSPLNILFSSNNTQLISQDEDYCIKVWDISNDQFSKVELIKHNSQTPYNTNKNSMSFSIDFKYLAFGYDNSSLEIWNVEKGIINSLKQKNVFLQYVI